MCNDFTFRSFAKVAKALLEAKLFGPWDLIEIKMEAIPDRLIESTGATTAFY